MRARRRRAARSSRLVSAWRRQRLGDDARDGLARIERSIRVLEHHLDVAPGLAQLLARQRMQVAPEQPHAAGGGRSNAMTSRARVDLPEPDSPTMPRLRPLAMREAHAIERMHLGRRPEQLLARHRVLAHQVLDLQQRRLRPSCGRPLPSRRRGHRVEPDAARLVARFDLDRRRDGRRGIREW